MKITSENASDGAPSAVAHSSIPARLVEGVLAGALATWVMTQFQERAGPEMDRALSSAQPRPSAKKEESPTVMIADLIYKRVAGHRIPKARRPLAGLVVHYSFGTVQGMKYSLMSRKLGGPGPLSGALFGAGLWLVADEVMLPALKFARPPQEYPLATHVKGLLAHLVYGLALGSSAAALERFAPKLGIAGQGSLSAGDRRDLAA